MDLQRRLSVVPVPSAPLADADVTQPETCRHCARRTVLCATGTVYCCELAELNALRQLRTKLERQLAIELENPPSDQYAAGLLALLHGELRRARPA
jgi:hypothetical protein